MGRSVIEPSEAEFQTAVLDLASMLGWRYYHTHDSRRSPHGFPDLVLVRPPIVLFVELKSPSGVVQPDQRVWLEELARCGLNVRVWRPDDWEEIEKTLMGARVASGGRA